MVFVTDLLDLLPSLLPLLLWLFFGDCTGRRTGERIVYLYFWLIAANWFFPFSSTISSNCICIILFCMFSLWWYYSIWLICFVSKRLQMIITINISWSKKPLSWVIGSFCYLRQEFITREISLVILSWKVMSFICFARSRLFCPSFVRIYSILSKFNSSYSKQNLSALEKFI